MTSRYAIIDIETTGLSAARCKIIEIAVVIHDGAKVVETFSSLVNPECRLPPMITSLTGIRDEDLEDAPRFASVAKKIIELTAGTVFVAHNARFDYSFVKKEFADLGFRFQRKTLCTVRLARKYFPGYPSYGLQKLKAAMELSHQGDAHRALSDALVTAELFQKIYAKHFETSDEPLEKSESSLLPSRISQDLVDSLPDETGLYFFYNERRELIYVGKSNNIRKRVVSHFQAEHRSFKGLDFKNSVADISFEVTGSELVALLRESELVKKHKPQFNRQLKASKFGHGVFCQKDEKGFLQLRLGEVENEHPAFFVKSLSAGKNLLSSLVTANELCFARTSGLGMNVLCARCQFGECREDEAAEYNRRVLRLVNKFQAPKKSKLVIDQGRGGSEKAVVYLHKGTHIGYTYVDEAFAADYSNPIELARAIKLVEVLPDEVSIIQKYMSAKKMKSIALSDSCDASF